MSWVDKNRKINNSGEEGVGEGGGLLFGTREYCHKELHLRCQQGTPGPALLYIYFKHNFKMRIISKVA